MNNKNPQHNLAKIMFNLLPEPAQTIMRKEYPNAHEIVYRTQPVNKYVTHDLWELEQLIATVDPQIDSYLLSNPTTTAKVIKRIQNSPHDSAMNNVIRFKALKHPNCDVEVIDRVMRVDLRLVLTEAPAHTPAETWVEWGGKIKNEEKYAPVLANPNFPKNMLQQWVDNIDKNRAGENRFLAQNPTLSSTDIKRIVARTNIKDWLLAYSHSFPPTILVEWLNEAFLEKNVSELIKISHCSQVTEQTLTKIVLLFQTAEYPNKLSHLELIEKYYDVNLNISKKDKLELLKPYYPDLVEETPTAWLNELFNTVPNSFWTVNVDGFTEFVNDNPGRVVGAL